MLTIRKPWSVIVNGSLIAVSIVVVRPCEQDLPPRNPVASLCQVLGKFERYAGKVVEVRADFISDREVVAIYGADCNSPLMIEGAARPAAAAVLFPRTSKVAGVVVDYASIEKLRAAVKADQAQASGPGFAVIIRGRLNTADEAPSYVDKNGQRRRLGFGHLSAFPFQIELIGVKILRVNPPKLTYKKK